MRRIRLNQIKKNEPTTFEFTKSDVTTGVELDGATLTVLDKDGNTIDSWTSVKNQPHVIKRLVVGETYILREEFAPYGYLKATDVEFTVKDTADVQKVEMKDEVPKALLIINKKGQFLDNVTLVDNLKGTVEHIFEYITGSLTKITFEIYAAGDIKAADGVSADYYNICYFSSVSKPCYTTPFSFRFNNHCLNASLGIRIIFPVFRIGIFPVVYQKAIVAGSTPASSAASGTVRYSRRFFSWL